VTTQRNATQRSTHDVIAPTITRYFNELQDVLLSDIFDLLHWCIHKEHEHLARTGTECLHILIMSNGAAFTDDSWELAVNSIKKVT
jgi:brefeldin A-inhibited guanine nucleotide-exchange protein